MKKEVMKRFFAAFLSAVVLVTSVSPGQLVNASTVGESANEDGNAENEHEHADKNADEKDNSQADAAGEKADGKTDEDASADGESSEKIDEDTSAEGKEDTAEDSEGKEDEIEDPESKEDTSADQTQKNENDSSEEADDDAETEKTPVEGDEAEAEGSKDKIAVQNEKIAAYAGEISKNGYSNIADQATITTNGNKGNGDSANMVDGNTGTIYIFNENLGDERYVALKFGENHKMDAFSIAFEHVGDSDETNFKFVYSIFGKIMTDGDWESGDGWTTIADHQTANRTDNWKQDYSLDATKEYNAIKIVMHSCKVGANGTDNGWPAIAEFEVYGEIVKGSAVDDSMDIAPSEMTVEAGSEYPGTGNEGPARFVLDGDETTHWHTNYNSYEDKANRDKHYLIFTFTDVQTINGIRYLRRANGGNGAVKKFDLYISKTEAGDDWTRVVENGTFDSDSGAWQKVSFDNREGIKRVKFVVLDSVSYETEFFASAAEIRFTGTCDHEWVDEATDQPTCTEPGKKVYKCSKCNEQKAEAIAPIGHDYSSEFKIDQEATYDTAGSKSKHCSRCDEKSEVTEIPPLADISTELMSVTAGSHHQNDDKEGDPNFVLDGNTETRWHTEYYDTASRDNHYLIFTFMDVQNINGIRYLRRTDGGNGAVKQFDLYVSAKESGDNWVLAVENGTLSAEDASWQWVKFEQTFADVKRVKFAVVDAVGMYGSAAEIRFTQPEVNECTHSYGEAEETVAATCTMGGKATYVCTSCGAKKYVGSEALGHDFGAEDNFTVDVAPTYTAEGSKSRHCSRCGEKTDVTVIPPLSDIDPAKMTVVAGTQSGDGESASKVLDGDENTIWHSNYLNGDQNSRDNHYLIFTFDEAKTINKMRYLCRQGDGAINGRITKFHLYVSAEESGDDWVLAVENGTFDGEVTTWQEYSFTPVTNVRRVKMVVVDARSDSGGLFASAAEIRFANAGSTCEHIFDEEHVEVTAATCTEAGQKKYTCTKDDCDVVKLEYIAVTGHAYGEWEETKASTCISKGEEKRVCKDCQHEDTQEKDLIDHVYAAEYTEDEPATCTSEGSKSRHCTVEGCKATTDSQPIEKLGHDFGEWTVSKAATCTEEGSKSHTCQREDCGKTETETITA